MKQFLTSLALIALLAIFAQTAAAGTVYDRATNTVWSTGTTWTNVQPYAALQLIRIWVLSSSTAADTCTVTRVTSDNINTQAVGTVAVASGVGNTASFTAGYMRANDKLMYAFTSGTNTSAIIQNEFIVQTH